MPTFEFQTPNGTYEVQAPDQNTAFKALQTQISAPGRSNAAVLPDVLKSGASGIARGALDLVGLPGTIGDALQGGLGWALRHGYEAVEGQEPSPTSDSAVERFFAGPSDAMKREMIGGEGSSPLSGAGLEQTAANATGGATAYKPQTTAGKYASTVGEFLPAAAIGGVNPVNLLKTGVLPALGSEAAGQATEGTALEPYARVGGAVLGGGLAHLRTPVTTAAGETGRDILNRGGDLYQQAKPVMQATSIDNPAYRKIAGDLGVTAQDFAPVPGQHDALTNIIGTHAKAAASGTTPTLSDLETIRKQLVNAGKTLDPSTRELSRRLIDTLDNSIDAIQPSNIVGNAQNANQALSQIQEARSIWRTGRKAEIIENAIDKAQNAASGTENGLRVEFRKILNNKKLASQFTGPEKTAIAKVARGTTLSNAARLIGTMGIPLDNGRNYLGALTGFGTGTYLGAGNPVAGVAATALGTGARALSGKLTRDAANVVDQMVKAGPQAQQVFQQLTQNASQAARTAILRAYLQARQALQSSQGQSASDNRRVPLAVH